MVCGSEQHALITFPCSWCLAFTLLLFSPVSESDDWPSWTGPLGRNAASGKGLPTTFDIDNEQNVRWGAKLGSVVFGCPAVSQGKVFAGTNCQAVRDDPRFSETQGGVVVCLDEVSGRMLWQLVAPVRLDGFPPRTHMVQQRWGICSSPTADGDRVYVVSNGGDVLCLDVNGLTDGNDGPFQEEAQFMAGLSRPSVELKGTDGDILWRYDIPRELSVAPHDVASCSVLIHGDVLYTSTSNGIGTGSPVYALNPAAPAFIALDKHTGQLLAVESEGISERLFHAQWSSPSLGRASGQGLILLGGADGVCYAFYPLVMQPDFSGDGTAGTSRRLTAAWRYDCNPPHYKRRNGKTIYYYQGDVRVYRNKRRAGQDTEGFNAGDGSFAGPNEILATPVFYENRVYIATGRDPLHGLARGVLHCIDATQTGDITDTGCIWRYEEIGRTLSTVAIDNGLVYAADLAGRLHCLDADTGTVYWIHDTKQELWGNPLVADDKVYLNTRLAFWVLAAGTEKRVLFMHRGGSECPPIAANGVVYVFTRGCLYALQDTVRH